MENNKSFLDTRLLVMNKEVCSIKDFVVGLTEVAKDIEKDRFDFIVYAIYNSEANYYITFKELWYSDYRNKNRKIMYKISEDIYSVVNDNLKIKEVSEENCRQILEKITNSFLSTEKTSIWLWENLLAYEALSDSNGWSYIKDFVRDNCCIMFFNQDEEKKMFEISNGKDLQCILSETSGFEFYIIDKNCSYLICFNHHDALLACGNAAEWIKRLNVNLAANGMHSNLDER